MLVNGLLILITEILWIIGGMALLRVLQRLFPVLLPESKKVPIAFLAICGLIFSTFVAAIASLLMRINWEFQLFWAILLALYAILDYRWIIQRVKRIEKLSFRRDFSLFILFAVIMVLVLATSADVDRTYDDGLYHLQSVMLISRHRAIPGIGLLHNRLAYNSFWHISGAVWGYQYFHPKQLVYFIATPVLMINFLLFLLGTLREEKNRWLQWSYLALLAGSILYLANYRFDFGSVSNDIPSFIMIWMIMIDFMRLTFSTSERRKPVQSYFLFLLLVAFAWTIKLSSLMLIIPAAYIFYLLWKNQRIAAIVSAEISGLILLIWAAHSVIASGYFVFPPPADWLGLPVKWKIPFALAHQSAILDMSWAKIPGAPAQTVNEMSLSSWFPVWYSALDKWQSLLFTGVILAMLWFTFSLVINQHRLNISGVLTPAIIFLCWMAAASLFWFFSYPAIRFLFGPAFPILGSAFLAAGFWLKDRQKYTSLVWSNGSVLAVTLFIILVFVRFNVLSEIDYTDIKIDPAPIPNVAIQQVPQNGFTINIPANGDQCWATMIPCVPEQIPDNIHLMGQTVFDGLAYINPQP